MAALAQKPYSVLTQWKIGGEGGWDYLTSDPAAHRLYVTHGPRVEVLDSDTGKVVGSITGLKGTHGVALDDSGKYGYVSDGGANAVVVFDRASLGDRGFDSRGHESGWHCVRAQNENRLGVQRPQQ